MSFFDKFRKKAPPQEPPQPLPDLSADQKAAYQALVKYFVKDEAAQAALVTEIDCWKDYDHDEEEWFSTLNYFDEARKITGFGSSA